MCRFNYFNEFIKHSLDYTFSHCKHPKLHIYGLAFRIIKYAYNLAKKYDIDFSIDNTKWTRAVNRALRLKGYKASCTTSNRQEFFDEYLKEIRSRGIFLENRNIYI